MIKIIIISIIFLTNMNSVNARVLTITEVNEAYKTLFINELNKLGTNLSSTIDTENKKINITSDSESIASFKYTDEYIEYDNREAVVSQENIGGNFSEMYCVAGLLQTILKLSNPDNEKTIDSNADFRNTYDTYGFQLETEHYEYNSSDNTEESWSVSGDYLKYMKISLDTDKINALLDEYGTDEKEELIKNLTPIVEAKAITENSITLVPSLNYFFNQIDEKIYCDVYRSNTKDGTYEKITSSPVDCTNSNATVVDSGLNSDTKYYYKASITGREIYSDIIEISTKKATVPAVNNVQNNAQNKEIENPKTGLFLSLATVLTMMIGSISVLMYAKKKSQIENNVD